MDIIGEFFGYLAGICTAIVFLPQSIKTIQTKDVGGISVATYVIYCIGMVSWIIYGIYLHSIPMMFFNSVSLVFAAIILSIVLIQRAKKN